MHNPCTPDCFAKGKDMEDYAKFRLHIIFKIGTLCCLDYQDITPAEREKASAVGAFAKTASPRETSGGSAEPTLELDIDAAVGEVEDDTQTRGSEFFVVVCVCALARRTSRYGTLCVWCWLALQRTIHALI